MPCIEEDSSMREGERGQGGETKIMTKITNVMWINIQEKYYA